MTQEKAGALLWLFLYLVIKTYKISYPQSIYVT